MEKPKSIEQKEIKKPELKIVPKRGDKNFMVAFEGGSKKDCQIYNMAISVVLKRHNLSPFHQVGAASSGDDEPGYHAWEVWQDISLEELKELIPEIEKEAKIKEKWF